MKTSLLNQLLEIVSHVEKFGTETVRTENLVHKQDANIHLPLNMSAIEMHRKGIDIRDYKVVKSAVSPISEAIDKLGGIPTKRDIQRISYILDTIIKNDPKVIYQKKLNNYNQKINKLQKDGESDELYKTRLDRVQLYIDYGKHPRINFSDILLYNDMKA
jgi:hypothetical protein